MKPPVSAISAHLFKIMLTLWGLDRGASLGWEEESWPIPSTPGVGRTAQQGQERSAVQLWEALGQLSSPE